MKTRDRILKLATDTFNEKGYSAVNLLEIAQVMGISRGNVAYHFKNKDLLLQAIVEEMWEQIAKEKKKARELPSFENLHNEIQLYYTIQCQYSFIFLDPHVSNHPVVSKRIRQMIQQSIENYMISIAFAIQLGNVKEEPVPGAYQSLAFAVWMMIYYWLSQQVLRGEKIGIDAEKSVWGLMVPHMTQKGITSFKKFFGEAYYNELGIALETDLKKIAPLSSHW